MSKILIAELVRNKLRSLWLLINDLGKWCRNIGHRNSHSFIPFLHGGRIGMTFMEEFMAKERSRSTPPPHSRVLTANLHAPFHCGVCTFNHANYKVPTCHDAANQDVQRSWHEKIMPLHLPPSHRARRCPCSRPLPSGAA